MKVCAVIMAGGSGERFWPLSTPGRPKQLLDLSGSGITMLEESAHRIDPLATGGVFVSTSRSLAEPIAESGVVSAANILAEPCKRNTLGALIWSMATLAHLSGDSDFLVGIVTADHLIRPVEAFRATVSEALATATETGGLVTIGIPPTRAETGYGYIEMGHGTKVERFYEKPDAQTAAEFLARGRFLWNSGMFFWRRSAFERELAVCQPEAFRVYETLRLDPIRGEDLFEELPNLSIDKAVMEKSANVHVVPATFEWDDVGSWDSLLRSVDLDRRGNAWIGDCADADSHGCVAYNTAPGVRVFTLGLAHVAVVVTQDRVAVFPLSRAQEVRKLADLDHC